MRQDIENARYRSDEEIIEYLKEYWGTDRLVFSGVLSKIEKNKDFSGSIKDIKLNDKPVSYPNGKKMSLFNLPITEIVPFEGLCKFECSLQPETKRIQKNNPFALKVIYSSIRPLPKTTHVNINRLEKRQDIENFQDWTDEEIINFFSDNILEGIFSKEIRSGNKDYYKGHIHTITINGVSLDVIGSYINVPTSANDIPEGKCTFKCRVKKDDFRISPSQIKVSLSPRTLRSKIKENFSPIKEVKDGNEVSEEIVERTKYELKIKDDRLIGLFEEGEEGSYIISDIRRSNFSKLILQNKKPQTPITFRPTNFVPQNGTYYEFKWVLRDVQPQYKYDFGVRENSRLTPIYPRTLVEKLHNTIMDYDADPAQKIVKMLDTLRNQLTASGKEIFIYELLQNANDYPNVVDGKKEKVDVEFRLTLDSLIFMHSGAEFNEKQIAAICNINDKEKDDNKETIGYKGIGFKTVFLDNNYVLLRTGGYSLRFDEEATKHVVDTPWQILPVWTEPKEYTAAEHAVFKYADPKFRVKFSLHPTRKTTLRGPGQNYEEMFKELFKNERIILFIPNLASVKIYLKGSSTPDIICERENGNWRVDDFYQDVDNDVTQRINAEIEEQEKTHDLKIPTKYYNFESTKISFACEVRDKKLIALKDSILYCYLPAKEASWGLKFLMNTDMIPNGPRDDIETEFSGDINVNEEISKLAGAKLFDWILKLCNAPEEYDLESAFNLIPNFDYIVRNRNKYRQLIDAFKDGFESRLEDEDFIPVDRETYVNITEVILDKTGITSSGIMTDEEFLSLTDNDDKYLPDPELRGSQSFASFMTNYLDEFDCEENIFSWDDLVELCATEKFQNWLKIQDNNNRFIKFLLDNGKLEDFIDQEVFIEEGSGELYKAENLFYDVEEPIKDLAAFSSYIDYLSLKTREYFNSNPKWEKFVYEFNQFDAETFINDKLLAEHPDDVKKILSDSDASLHFYDFIAKNDVFDESMLDLPFIDDSGSQIADFNDKFIFTESEDGKAVSQYGWLTSADIAFISSEYSAKALDHFKSHFDVRDYSDSIIINEIILSEDYKPDIQDAIDDYSVNESFVAYCYTHRDLLPKDQASLSCYVLSVSDDGESYDNQLTEDLIVFPCRLFDDYLERPWTESGWAYCIDKDYFENIPEDEDGSLADFFRKHYGVKDFTEDVFYSSIVSKHLTEVIGYTSGSKDAEGDNCVDFVKYLNDNYHLIFEVNRDADSFKKLVIFDENGYDIEANTDHRFLYNKDLEKIISLDWFPAGLIAMASQRFGNSPSLKAIGFKNFEVGDFYESVIATKDGISAINDEIDSKEASVAFHKFVLGIKGKVKPERLSAMKDAIIYVDGVDTPAQKSCGHRIPSKTAKELLNLGILPLAQLDIIDKDYESEKDSDYWEKVLENKRYTIDDFVKWANSNHETLEKSLKDVNTNIAFWRWIRSADSEQLKPLLKTLPILLKGGETSFSKIDDAIYIADEYAENEGIESVVKEFNPSAARFVSPDYMASEVDSDKWFEFWKEVGIHYDVVDVLIHSVVPDIANARDNEKLPSLLAKYRDELTEAYPEDLLVRLYGLKVKCQDKSFRPLRDIIYVNCDKVEEPFAFISLPNQAEFDYLDVRHLIVDILNENNGKIINIRSEWFEEKVARYLKLQNSSKFEAIEDMHYAFIDELAGIHSADRNALNTYKESLKQVLLLDSDSKLVKPDTLTLASIYRPYCDFQQFGINLKYTNASYNDKCTNRMTSLFRGVFNVHGDFREVDVPHLANRAFAIYFWKEYLTADVKNGGGNDRISRIKKYIESGAFNNIACIPTQNLMKKPDVVYSRFIENYVKHTNDYEDKLPLTELPEIACAPGMTLFDCLPFRHRLSFADCLTALFDFNGKESRPELLRWALAGYDSSEKNIVDQYRTKPEAKWFNMCNDKKHISELYALEEGDQTLVQYFGGSDLILNPEYLPKSEFNAVCDMMLIRVIHNTEEDLRIKPAVNEEISNSIKSDLIVCCLVIAALQDSENWKELFEGFKTKLDSLKFYTCDSIFMEFKEDPRVCQNHKKFYYKEDTSECYFVGKYSSPLVYSDFVRRLREILGIDIDYDLQAEIMMGPEYALDEVKRRNNLCSNKEFVEALDMLIPDIKREIVGKEADDHDASTELAERPVFKPESEETVDQSDEEGNDGNDGMNGLGETEEDEELDISGDGPETTAPVNPHGDPRRDPQKNPVRKTPQEPSNEQGQNPRPKMGQEPKSEPCQEPKHEPYHEPRRAPQSGGKPYTDHTGWNDKGRKFNPLPPKPFSPEDVRNFGSKSKQRSLDILDPSQLEVDTINRILGGNLSAEEIADQNYLAQLRLYRNLRDRGMAPKESEADFVKNAHLKNEHSLLNGKYIHKCSAAGGIMYLSPSIWNKIADENCVVCVYLGAKSNEFMYFNSIEEILEWIREDDIVIKLTGDEKAKVVETLYSGVLNGVTGTAYTLIRIGSKEEYNSIFAPLDKDPYGETVENPDEYSYE